MNTRFYNAKILVLDAENHFSIAEDELHVTGDTITYIGPGRKADPDAAETTVFDREIDARGNLLIPGFKNAHTHTPMTSSAPTRTISRSTNGSSARSSRTRQSSPGTTFTGSISSASWNI